MQPRVSVSACGVERIHIHTHTRTHKHTHTHTQTNIRTLSAAQSPSLATSARCFITPSSSSGVLSPQPCTTRLASNDSIQPFTRARTCLPYSILSSAVSSVCTGPTCSGSSMKRSRQNCGRARGGASGNAGERAADAGGRAKEHARVHAHVPHTHACVHAHAHTHARVHTHTHAHKHAKPNKHTHTHENTHTHTHTC